MNGILGWEITSINNIKFKYLEVVNLNFDDETTGKFKYLDLIQLDGNSYIVLLPDRGKGDIVQVYRLENIENKSTLRYLPVKNKEIENKVLDIYNNGKNNYLHKKSRNTFVSNIILITLSIATIAINIMEPSWNKDNEYKDTITMSDVSSMISKIVPDLMSVDPDYKSSTDENGRKICTFSYTAHPWNNQGMTLLDKSYSGTVTYMIMKKNGVVKYAIWPNSYYDTTYKNFEDFKEKNNWGKPESYGLGDKAYILEQQ